METAKASKAFRPNLDLLSEGDHCVVMNGLDWKGYSAILRAKGERYYPKMVYLDGSLWLMTAGFSHECIRARSARFVDEVSVGTKTRYIPMGSPTYRRKKKRGGFEPDQSYYFSNTPVLTDAKRSEKQVDLRNGPPPDLVIEIVYTHGVEVTIATCRRLGVPEVWACDERQFRILVRRADGQYAESATGLALTFVTGEEIESWLRRPYGEGEEELQWSLDLRAWVAEVLTPRVRREDRP